MTSRRAPRSGVASPAIVAPTASGQARWTVASSVCGARRPGSDRAGAPPGAGCGGAGSNHRLLADTGRRATASRVTPTSAAPGTCSRSVVVITDWPLRSQDLDQRVAAVAVELAHHVVEQHQRRRVALGGDRLALGQQQRQQREPLLALRAVGAQLASLAQGGEVVAVGPVAGEAALEVAVDALGQLGRRAPPASSPASAAGRRARRRRSRPSASASRAERARRARRAPGARSRISARPCAASCAIPGGQRVARGRRRRGSARAARCAARAPARRRGGSRPGRPQRGDELVEVGAAQRRRTLDQLEPVGQEDAHQRPGVDVEQALDGRAVGAHPLGLPGLEADRELVRRRPRRRRARPPAWRPAPKRTTSRSFAVRHERPVQPKYSASSRLVLPAPLGPDTTVRPSPSATSRCRRSSGSRER